MSNTNKKERMLNEVNEHLDSFGRWNNGFEDEFETVMYLMTQKIQYLSNRAKDSEIRYADSKKNDFKEIKDQYETIWTDIVDDLANIYSRVSNVHDDMKKLQKENELEIFKRSK